MDKSDTPRLSLPPTPRLNFQSMPEDSHSEVEMPFTPRSQQTPRIEAYPQGDNEEQDEEMEGENLLTGLSSSKLPGVLVFDITR